MLLAASWVANAASVLSVRDTITDPNVVYPESFEADTHKMMQNWYLQNYTELDRDVDNRPDKPTTDDEYIQRLKTMPTVIEMPFNGVVKNYIELYTQRRRSLVERMLGMSTYYMPIFEQALEIEGVPLELKYLPIIESALDPNAVSRAGATGLWQFMLQTARGLGLEINSLVDERRDPIKSSQMAAKYLRQLYDMYNDWSLAIAAYNCGPGNVNKALRRAGEGKKDFWDIYPYLPAETRGYVPGFIGANYVMNYFDRHNISPALAKRPIVTDTIHVTKRVHFQQIADVLNIPIDEIRILNPQYRQDIIPGDIKPYALVLPSQQVLSYVISEDSIVAHNAALYAHRDVVEPADPSQRVGGEGEYVVTEVVKYHKVRKGDTFANIAKRYGVTASSIKRVNGIKSLKRGRTIKIVTTKRTYRPKPADDSTQPTEVIETEAPITNDAPEPQVEDNDPEDNAEAEGSDADEAAGDAVDTPVEVATESVPAKAVATANAATAEESTEAHRVEDSFSRSRQKQAEAEQLKAEQEKAAKEQAEAEKAAKLKAQQEKAAKDKAAKDKAKKKAEQPVYHKVKKGENLYKIAKRYNTTVQKIESLNPGMKASKINFGQSIRVK
jgi:membrane-bound lytic murein transglycosylase D